VNSQQSHDPAWVWGSRIWVWHPKHWPMAILLVVINDPAIQFEHAFHCDALPVGEPHLPAEPDAENRHDDEQRAQAESQPTPAGFFWGGHAREYIPVVPCFRACASPVQTAGFRTHRQLDTCQRPRYLYWITN